MYRESAELPSPATTEVRNHRKLLAQAILVVAFEAIVCGWVKIVCLDGTGLQFIVVSGLIHALLFVTTAIWWALKTVTE